MSDGPKHIVIIGGGLAGSFLAARLVHAGQKVSLFDQTNGLCASRIAAGMFNVITGRFGAKTWMAEELLNELKGFFEIPMFQPLQKYVHPLPIYRPFKNIEDYNKWTGRAGEPAYKDLVAFEEKPLLDSQIINPLGGIRILPCGWLDTVRFLEELGNILSKNPLFQRFSIHIKYPQIQAPDRSLLLDGQKLSYDHLVFCEGVQAKNNPFFPDLPIIPNLGEILLIKAPELKLPFILSKKIYLIPQDKGIFLCGSTYINHIEQARVRPEAAEEIGQHVKKAIKIPYQILDSYAGIRPTTKDRRPIIGSHSKFKHIHLIAGFGTKGVLLAPSAARWMTAGILYDQWQIPNAAQLSRFQ